MALLLDFILEGSLLCIELERTRLGWRGVRKLNISAISLDQGLSSVLLHALRLLHNWRPGLRGKIRGSLGDRHHLPSRQLLVVVSIASFVAFRRLEEEPVRFSGERLAVDEGLLVGEEGYRRYLESLVLLIRD